jgi:hypothetical protein
MYDTHTHTHTVMLLQVCLDIPMKKLPLLL